MDRIISRRKTLALITAVGTPFISGCAGNSSISDVYLDNNTNESIEYTVSVTRLRDGEVVLNDSDTIGPKETGTNDSDDDSQKYEDPMKEDGTYRIDVSTADGAAGSREFESCGSMDACGLIIFFEDESIEFSRTVA